jgi:hypothetical protein
MKKYIRCKSCGYIMEEGAPGDKCPACGVPRTMFQPYTPDISEKRARILNLHVHPVIVHAPQALAFITLVAVLFHFAFPVFVTEILDTIKVLSFLLPIVAIGSFLTGLLDGKIRFRKVTTPLLVRKMVFGAVFFVFSSVMAVSILLPGIDPSIAWPVFLASNLVCVFASVQLGLIGTSIINARFPG